jgi:F-type H+-transporting ATPase subunit delta
VISSAIVDRYARAVFELGVETGKLTELTQELVRIAGAYRESRDLRAVLDNPLVSEEQRDALLKDLATRLRLSELATNTVRLLARRRRLVALPDIADRVAGLADDKAGIVRAKVITAAPLSEDFYAKLTQKLEQKTRKKVVIEREQDPSLIAGVITKIGDNTIDGSLRGRLQALESQLLSNQ